MRISRKIVFWKMKMKMKKNRWKTTADHYDDDDHDNHQDEARVLEEVDDPLSDDC